jgi:hypothetical protein
MRAIRALFGASVMGPRFLLAVAVVLVGVPRGAGALMMDSTFESVLESAQTIVIAKYSSPSNGNSIETYELRVERTLRGVHRSRLKVKPSPNGRPPFADGTRVVAFIDATNRWIFYATEVAGSDLEHGVLEVRGFRDFNVHVVTPGVMTLAQLEAHLATGAPMSWTFRGSVMVLSPRGLVRSGIEIVATVPGDRVVGTTAIASSPKPTISVGDGLSSAVDITWAREVDHSLALEGVATGKAPDGAITVQYRLRDVSLTEAQLRAYLADARRGHPYYVLELKKGAAKIPVVLGKDSSGIGTIGSIPITATSGPNEIQGVVTSGSSSPIMSTSRGRHFFQAGDIIVWTNQIGYRAKSGGDTLIEELMVVGPIKCTYAEAGARSPCTLRYVATKFTPL